MPLSSTTPHDSRPAAHIVIGAHAELKNLQTQRLCETPGREECPGLRWC